MPQFYFSRLICSWIFSVIIFASANGQSNSLQSKLVRTQHTNQYASISCGLQDKAGKLWFGSTGEGVYCYDGKSFSNFTTNNGLKSNCIYTMLQGNNGNIWFGTDSGICRYDGQSFSTLALPFGYSSSLYLQQSPHNTPAMNNAVYAMVQDRSGKLWFATNNGIYCYNGKSFTLFLDDISIINKENLNLKNIRCILQDKAGNIWFASWFEGSIRFDGKSLSSFKPNGEVWFASIFEDSKGNIWAGRRDKGACRYDGTNWQNILQHGIFDLCGVHPELEDQQGNIWFASEFGDIVGRENHGGLWKYDGSTFTNYTTANGLPDNSINCVVQDKAGNLWIGSRNMGLCKFDGKVFVCF